MDDLLAKLRAAGETTRLRLLTLLARGELNVSDITSILGQSQPRVSRHLKMLCDAGLLSRYREGQWVIYRLAEAGSGAALARSLVDQVPENDPLVTRDRERLDRLRADHAARAESYFSTYAASWDDIRKRHIEPARINEAILDCLGRKRIGTLLDLGTGTGSMLELLAAQCDVAIGIDSQNEMLSHARAKLQGPRFRHIQLRHGDINRLPYDDDIADLAVLHQVLHYLDDPETALGEAGRLIKPGGRLLVVDFAPHELEVLRETHAHRRLGISADQMTRWLTATGLKLLQAAELPPEDDGAPDGLSVSLWLAEKPAAKLDTNAGAWQLEVVS